ncbi:unnamed protein product [Cylindrotheca closterium]|uniref:BZIP domain-containing protein n=1 Tax=Cylindrotheca closterium TaxID=2856 RepID=A0AAD2G1S6_9STRA|nr:unnamed protein product [Cylindrotheca closterium]
MKSKLDSTNADGEASSKRHKSTASLVSTTKSEAGEAGRDRSGHTSNDAVQERKERSKGSLSTADNDWAEAEKSGDDSQSWTAVKKDRNRLNAQRGRQKQQAQLKFLEHEQMRFSSSNAALQYQNSHLKDVIQQIKKQRDSSKKKHPAAPDGAGTPTTELNTRFPSQKTAPSMLSQQQLATLLMRNGNTTRAIANVFPPRQELPATSPLLQLGAGAGGNISHASASSFGGSSAPNFCCQVFMLYSALNPATRQIYQGACHHPLCRNYRI